MNPRTLRRLDEPRYRPTLRIGIGAWVARKFTLIYPTYRALMRLKSSMRGSLMVFVLTGANLAALWLLLTAGKDFTPPPHQIIRLQINLHHLNFLIFATIIWVKVMRAHRVYIPRGKLTG